MKKIYNFIRILLFLSIIMFSLPVWSQLNVDVSYSAFDLVQNILIGQGITVTNVQFTGNNAQKAYFYGTTNIGFTDGVLLTTGGATVAIGPNNSGSASVSVDTPGDADLSAIIGVPTNDASVLEFDFIPQADTISFYYVFASEEYPEFVCSSFNDVFAFLLTGPDPSGGMYNKKNIAIIPNTNLPVAINTVNPGYPGSGYSASGCTSLAYSQYYVDNTGGQTIQFDGFTVPLKAFAHVVPCETYHIKLAIADATDHSYDSGVFLQAGSFSANSYDIQMENINISESIPDNSIIEGLNCGSYTQICFTRSFDINTNDTLTIFLDGTAINGVDYIDENGNPIPTQFIFTPDTYEQCINIYAIADTLDESTETIIIKVPSLNPCIGSDTIRDTVYIINHMPFEVYITGDTIICEGESGQLIANTTQFPAFFHWSTGSQMGSINIHPTQEITYYSIIGTDEYMCIDYDTIMVRLLPKAEVNLGNDTCITSGPFALDATQQNSVFSYLWSTGHTTSMIDVLESGIYWVSVTNSTYDMCDDADTINVKIIPTPIVDLPQNILLCSHEFITLSASQFNNDLYEFIWSDGSNDTNYILDKPLPGIYDINVKVIGCDTISDVNYYHSRRL